MKGPPLDELLESELKLLDQSDADRLCNILRGLFTCVKDLNDRVAELESGYAVKFPQDKRQILKESTGLNGEDTATSAEI